MNNIFYGLITALITPFKDGRIDFLSLEKILEYQIANDIDALLIAGVTGEGLSLNREEYSTLLQAVLDINKKRVPIIVGYASNTKSVVEMALESEQAKVDGLMVVVPPYVKPSQAGLYEHFKTIHDATNLPIMLYSAPSRAGTDFIDDTIIKLSALPRIMAMKDCGADIERPLRLSAKLAKDFHLLTGDDSVYLAYSAQGGVGCVSVASNIMPKLCKELQAQWKKGNFKSALKIHQQLLPLYKALFKDGNPTGVKYAAQHLGLCSSELRLPLVQASPETKLQIEEAINKLLTEYD
jgi:4-hydroxy-tetrahydrodipicolinate synthase